MPVYRIFDREHILCETCHGEVLLKSGAAGVAGLPFWIVGSFFTHSVANRIMEDAWEYKGQRGHCARCNARVATAGPIAVASQAAQSFHTPANLSELQKIFHDAKDFTLQVLQEKPQDASDPNILPHILKAWAGDCVVTFGRHGGGSASDPVVAF